MDHSETKWEAEGFWTGGLDLSGWESRLQIESKVTSSRPGSFSNLVIRPSAWVEGNFNSSWVLWTQEASQVPVTSAGSLVIGLGLGHPQFELGPNQLSRRLAPEQAPHLSQRVKVRKTLGLPRDQGT